MTLHLGIDIGGTWIKHGAIDADGHILFADRTPTCGNEGKAATLDAIVGCARRMSEWAKSAGHRPVSIGIGSPGTINPRTHIVQPPTPNLTTIIGENLAQLVERDTGLPTVVDNDANCAAWAENRYGAGRGIDNLICITVGSGIGSGFIVDGRIYSGPTGSGGELGHVTIDWQGPVCGCGNRGCLENYVSANALALTATNAAKTNPLSRLASMVTVNGSITIADLYVAAREHDSAAVRILDTAALQLALGLLNAVNLFDPEAVIIGGGAADADIDGSWIRRIGEYLHRHAFSQEGKTLPVGKAALGNDAGFIGAAALGALLVSGKRVDSLLRRA